MKKLPILILLFLITIAETANIKAQQDILITQFWNAKTYFNPATSGLNYRHQAVGLARWQWIGVNGAPDSQFLGYSMKMDKIHGGLGVTYLHDKIGFNEQHLARVNYSYQISLKNDGLLSFGLAVGLDIFKMSAVWIPPTTAQDPYLPENFSQTNFNADFGVAYSKDKLNCGISVTKLNEAFGSSIYQSARHYYVFTDYTFGNENAFQFKPQMLIRTDFVKMSMDLNLSVIFRSKYSLGLSYRTSDAICFIAGWDIKKKYRIAYSYDLTINKLSGISRGSHEIVLGFLLK